MAKRTAILSVRVISDTKQAQKGAQETATAWEKFEKRLDRASIAAGLTGAAVFKLGTDAYKMASDLQQSTGAVAAVFGEYQKEITDFAETSWDTVGLSQHRTQEMATLIGSQLKNLGMPMKDVGAETLNLVKLGSDLAATYGGSTQQAVEALSATLRGERDPIERYGVTITQAMINAEKAAMGLDGLTGAADRQADMQATLALLTKQTADAQGMFAAEAGTAENSAQKMAARWETVQGQLGEKLLPIITALSLALIDVIGWISENEDVAIGFATAIAGTAAAILGLNAAIKTARVVSSVFTGITSAGSAAVSVVGRFVSGMRSAQAAGSAFSGVAGTLGGKVASGAKALADGAVAAGKWAVQTTILTAKMVAQKTAQLAIAAASKVVAAAQWLWNAAVNANPIFLIITLIIAAITILILNWDKVKAVALVVWDAITTAATWFWENVLVPIGTWIKDNFTKNWEIMRIAAILTWNLIKTAGQTVWNWIKQVAAWIASNFVANWNRLKAAAVAVWNGIKNAGSNMWNGIKSIANWIRNTFVNAWNTLKNVGLRALNAFIDPIRNLIGWVQDAIGWVGGLFSKASAMPTTFEFSAQHSGGGVPAIAAAGPSPLALLAGLTTARSGDVNINIEIPNYVGSRQELVTWLRDALKRADVETGRLIRS